MKVSLGFPQILKLVKGVGSPQDTFRDVYNPKFILKPKNSISTMSGKQRRNISFF